MSSNLPTLVAHINDAYARYRAEKKTPHMKTVRTVEGAKEVHEKIVAELAKIRANIELYRAFDRGVSLSPSWKRAARDAISKMQTYKRDFITAEKRWRSRRPGTRSVYPATERTDTGIALASSVNALFRAIQDKYKGTMRNAPVSVRIVERPSVPSNENVGKSPTFMLARVEEAWKRYVKVRRKATKSLTNNVKRTIDNELTLLRINLTTFKAIQARVEAGTKPSLVPMVRRVISLYKTYIGHYESAYIDATRGKNPPVSPLDGSGVPFGRAAVRFMHFAASSSNGTTPIANVSYARSKARLTPGEVLNKHGINSQAVTNMLNRINHLERTALKMNTERSFKNLSLRQATQQLQNRKKQVNDLSRELMEVTDAFLECERKRKGMIAKS